MDVNIQETIESSSESSESIGNSSSSSSYFCKTVQVVYVSPESNIIDVTWNWSDIFGRVYVNGIDEGDLNPSIGQAGISFIEPGIASTYTVGEFVEVCEGSCDNSLSSSSSSSFGYSSSSSSSSAEVTPCAGGDPSVNLTVTGASGTIN